MKNIKLGPKLIGGFCLTALIALAIGIICILGMRDLSDSINVLGTRSLPTVEHLLRMKGSINELTTNLRTLLSTDLTAQQRRDTANAIQNIREEYGKSLEIYRDLPHSQEESALWSQCQDTLNDLTKTNNRVLELNQRLVMLDIMAPNLLMEQLQQFRGDHYKLVTQIDQLLATNTPFDGGEDHLSCAFGKWAGAFTTTNPKLQTAINAVQEDHQKFHTLIRDIKDAVARGNAEATTRSHAALLVTAENVFTQFRNMRAEAEEPQKALEDMGTQLMVEAKPTQDKLDKLLVDIVQLSTGISATTITSARDEAGQAMVVAGTGMAIGVVIALALGLLLTRSITAPVYKGVEFAKKIAQGDLTAEVDVNQKDELGILA
ncbi:MAG: methyl-accepting chemotaxis protein, partial [Deltaproteobacteria bacterium]|nr:methyl-accepting chemotaxis protein [Deltaproteobacteria bacterium]